MSGGSLLKKASAPHDYSLDYLTFVALEDGTFQLSTNNVSYSLDNGNTWVTLSAGTASPTVSAGSKIMWKGTLTPNSSNGIGTFSSTGGFGVCGNAMSLLFGDAFVGVTDLTGKDYAFSRLFQDATGLETIENLSLPATVLSNNCYASMFYRCSNLIGVPVDLLNAKTMIVGCYSGMFSLCTSLSVAPDLPATTLATRCYASMFYGTNFTTAPVLPAKTLVDNCYANMFNNCSSLNYIKVKCTTKPSSTYSNNWLNGVAASGTFVKTGSWSVTRSASCVPENWTVQTVSS